MATRPTTTSNSTEERAPWRLGDQWWWRWFWRLTLVVSLGVVWYCFYVPSNDIAWAADVASARQEAVRSNKRVILFFTGTWCVPCRIMKRTVWADEQVAASVNAEFIPVTIDVDEPGAAESLSRYRVGRTPTLIVAEAQGDEVRRVEGGIGKAEFLELLRALPPLGAGGPRP